MKQTLYTLISIWLLSPTADARLGDSWNFTFPSLSFAGSAEEDHNPSRKLNDCTFKWDLVDFNECEPCFQGIQGCSAGHKWRITRSNDGRKSVYMKSDYDIVMSSNYNPSNSDADKYHWIFDSHYMYTNEAGSTTNVNLIRNVGRNRYLTKRDVGSSGSNNKWLVDDTDQGCDLVKIASYTTSSKKWWNNQANDQINLIDSRGQGEKYKILRAITDRENCAREWGGDSTEYIISQNDFDSRLYMKSDGSVEFRSNYDTRSASEQDNFHWRTTFHRNYDHQTVRLYNVGRQRNMEAQDVAGSRSNNKFLLRVYDYAEASCGQIELGFIDPDNNCHYSWLKYNGGMDWADSGNVIRIFQTGYIEPTSSPVESDDFFGNGHGLGDNPILCCSGSDGVRTCDWAENQGHCILCCDDGSNTCGLLSDLQGTCPLINP